MSEASKATAVTWAKALYGSEEVTPEVVKEMQELDDKWSGMTAGMYDTKPVDVFKNLPNPIPGVNVGMSSDPYEIPSAPPIVATLKLDNGEVLSMTSDPDFKPKLSGGKVNYYLVWVQNPQREEQAPYQAECEDIIEALGLNFDEGNIFKEIWRTANERNGNGKPGNNAVRAAEKIKHYAERILKRAKREQK